MMSDLEYIGIDIVEIALFEDVFFGHFVGVARQHDRPVCVFEKTYRRDRVDLLCVRSARIIGFVERIALHLPVFAAYRIRAYVVVVLCVNGFPVSRRIRFLSRLFEQFQPCIAVLRLVERHIKRLYLIVVEQLFRVANMIVVAVCDEEIIYLSDLPFLQKRIRTFPRRGSAEFAAYIHHHILAVGESDVYAVALTYIQHGHLQRIARDVRIVRLPAVAYRILVALIVLRKHCDHALEHVGSEVPQRDERGDDHQYEYDEEYYLAFGQFLFASCRSRFSHVSPPRQNILSPFSSFRVYCHRAW